MVRLEILLLETRVFLSQFTVLLLVKILLIFELFVLFLEGIYLLLESSHRCLNRFRLEVWRLNDWNKSRRAILF